MNVTVFLNGLSLGGTEKAACAWAGLLKQRHADWNIQVIALQDGPRRADLDRAGIPLVVCSSCRITDRNNFLAEHLQGSDVIHAHCPGTPHQGDVLGTALEKLGRKIPVVQTNIFGRLDNPHENAWTDFRLFISWTSCVQAARRAGRKLDLEFFRKNSVAVYPVLDPFRSAQEIEGGGRLAAKKEDGRWKMGVHRREQLQNDALELRERLGIPQNAVLFGRFSRPEPNKWTPMVLDAFLATHRTNPNIRLILREPPPAVAQQLISTGLANWFPTSHDQSNASVIRHLSSVILLPATSDPDELTISQLACDVVLHTSSFGESFGYGLAEPMALGKPVITNSTPWRDQAQIELARHGECGLLASTTSSMKSAILQMAERREWRAKCGEAARKHILEIANPEKSTNRVEMALKCAMDGIENPMAEQDLEKARKTAEYLDKHQWGNNFLEQVHLRSFTAKVTAFRAFHFLKKKLGVESSNR